MDADKYARSVGLVCQTCGNRDFEYDEELQGDGPIRCVSCDRTFTREELIRENGEIIEAEVDEVKREVVADLQKDFTETLRKAFRGSKNITFR